MYRRSIAASSPGGSTSNSNTSESKASSSSFAPKSFHRKEKVEYDDDEEETRSKLFESPPSTSSQSQPPKNTKMVMMSSRDRTNEFQTTIRTFQSRMVINPQLIQAADNDSTKPKSNTVNKPDLQQRQQFMMIAKKIGRDLTNTCIKLEKLTDLAKKRSLFDDKPKEIDELTYLIKQDINNLNSEIKRVQDFVKSNKNHDSKNVQKHSSNVVYTLQSKLKNVSNDFKHVLEVRTENLKKKNERGEKFFSKSTLDKQTAASMFAPPKMPGSQMGKSVLMYDDDASSSSSGLGSSLSSSSMSAQSNNGGGGGNTVLNMDLMQKQQLQKRLIVNEDETYLRERSNAMQTVEQTIVELGGIFSQLSTMIKEQEEQIQRIDSNVDDVELNISEAHSELLKYFQSVTSNRWLMVKIFGILIIFFIVFIVLMT